MKVRDLFERLRGRHVALLPNEGNCGDGLIAMGFRRLAREYSVSHTILLHPRPASGRILLVLGCGNLSRAFHHQVPRIRRYAPEFNETFLLPCSIDPAAPAVAEMLETLPSSVTIFCREHSSAEKIAPIVSGKNAVHLEHDLAFAVDYEPWQQRGAGQLNASAPTSKAATIRCRQTIWMSRSGAARTMARYCCARSPAIAASTPIARMSPFALPCSERKRMSTQTIITR